jgi:hypothetical protein
MKKTVMMVILAMATISMYAQKFGVKAGVNFSTYTGDDAGDLGTLTGFQVGGLYELPVSEAFFIQPEVLFTLKGAKSSADGVTTKLTPFYVQVPVKALYKFNVGTGKITIAAGPYLALGIAGKYKISGGGESESYNLFSKEDGADEAMLKRFDLGLSSAVGYEFNNGLFLNLESSLGFLDVAKDSNIKNSTLSLVAGFKF